MDEFHVDPDEYCKYALVIQYFYTGDPIYLLRSRRQNVTEPYFVTIPKEERNQVRYLISDMYNPYIRYVDKYFPNAVPVVDSFHVLQWVTNSIDKYIRNLIKKFKLRDREMYELRWHPGTMPDHIPPSREVYLLQKYRWLILANSSNITYHNDLRIILGRGYRNFEHFRTRFLYATRNNPVLNGSSGFNPIQYFEND